MSRAQDIQNRYGIHLLSGPLPSSMEEVEVFGMVHANAIVGVNFVRDFFSRVADVTGGRAGGFEKATRASIDYALEELAKQAAALGANAITSIDIDTSQAGRSMVMTVAYGTAIVARGRKEAELAPAPTHYLHPQPLG